MKTVRFEAEGESAEFFVLEQTTLGGISYLLVTDTQEGDGEAFILKDLSDTEDSEAVYEIVEDDSELRAIGQVFSELLEDISLV